MIAAVAKFLAGLVVTLGVLILIARLAFPLPEIENRQDTQALPPTTEGALAVALASQEEAHGGGKRVSHLCKRGRMLLRRVSFWPMRQCPLSMRNITFGMMI